MDINVKNYYFKGAQKHYVTNFRGNLTRNIRTLQLNTEELKQISAVDSMYRQINMIFSASGEYMKGVIKAGVGFLTAIGSAFMLQNTLQSDDVQNVKLEKDNDKMSFIVNGDESDDVLKISVSPNGNAEVFADEDLSEAELNKYINEFDKNHPKLFDTVYQKFSNAFQTIGQVLNKKQSSYNIDLNSSDDIKNIVSRFVDERRRLSLLGTLVDGRTFFKYFKFEKGMPKSIEQGELPDENISFTFSHLENKFFNGLQITVTDKNKNTRQGFVAMDDGNIYKTKLHDLSNLNDKFVPRQDWRIRNLQSLTSDEVQNPLLKRMFEYAYSHIDKVTKFFTNYLYEQNKNYAQKYDISSDKMKYQINRLEKARMERINKFNVYLDNLTEKYSARTEAPRNKRISEDRAKIIKVYNLSPEYFDLIKKLSALNDRISEANYSRQYNQRLNFLSSFNIVRREFQNGLIYKNIFNSDKYYPGLARYIYKRNSEEIVNFGLFDKEFNEVARFKATKNGKVKLIVQPNTTLETVKEIENFLKEELNNGLAEKLYSQMDYAAYYLENTAKVDNYIARAYEKISVYKAIDELRNNKEYYKFDPYAVNSIKDTLEAIREVYNRHAIASYRWQNMYYPENTILQQKYLYGRLESQNINYDVSYIDNKRYFSGIRVLTRDEKGKFLNCYVIDYDGNAYKLIKLPENNRIAYLNYTKVNLSPLDEKAVKNEYLDLILNEFTQNITSYKAYLDECSHRLEVDGRYKFSKNDILALIGKYKNGVQEVVSEPTKTDNHLKETTVRKTHKEVKAAPKKVGRPKKTIDKAVTKTEKPKKAAVVKTAPKTVAPKKEKPVVKAKTPVTKQVEQVKIERTLSPELKERYADMLKPNGEFKPLAAISLKDVTSQLDRIFAMPYTERSPHLIHEKLDSGRIFEGRFSTVAPDGAIITVSRVKSPKYVDFLYYSIKVQKDKEKMFINIDPDPRFYEIIESDENKPILKQGYKIDHVSKKDFMASNPLSKNMSMYFMEIFDERPDAERKVIPFQKLDDKRTRLAKQVMRDYQAALSAKMSVSIQKELEKEIDETEESEEI